MPSRLSELNKLLILVASIFIIISIFLGLLEKKWRQTHVFVDRVAAIHNDNQYARIVDHEFGVGVDGDYHDNKTREKAVRAEEQAANLATAQSGHVLNY